MRCSGQLPRPKPTRSADCIESANAVADGIRLRTIDNERWKPSLAGASHEAGHALRSDVLPAGGDHMQARGVFARWHCLVGSWHEGQLDQQYVAASKRQLTSSSSTAVRSTSSVGTAETRRPP